MKDLRSWLKTSLGQAFLNAEIKAMGPILETLFGYYFLVLGEAPFCNSVLKSTISNRILINPQAISSYPHVSSIRSRYDKLPILSNEVDVIYLAHCLEFIKNPHEVLREAFRSLTPEGHLIISGFNPWSFCGLWRILSLYCKQAPWNGHFISITRLIDWLALLGFEVVLVKKYQISNAPWIFGGGGYVLLARKQVITLTPIRPYWQTEKKALDSELEPAA